MGRLYNLDTMNERASGAARSESEENIIEMKGLGTGANDFAKSTDGSEAVSWAQSGVGTESDLGLKGHYIRKTTEIIIEKEADR